MCLDLHNSQSRSEVVSTNASLHGGLDQSSSAEQVRQCQQGGPQQHPSLDGFLDGIHAEFQVRSGGLKSSDIQTCAILLESTHVDPPTSAPQTYELGAHECQHEHHNVHVQVLDREMSHTHVHGGLVDVNALLCDA